MYCTLSNGVLYLVWTQDDGRLLAQLAGAPHLDAYLWWHNVDHEVAFPGSANMMPSMPRPGGTTGTSSGMSSTTGAQSKHSTSDMSGMSK